MDKLPQTIQDAVIVTRALNIRYLWIDALCIIQDSDDDKIRELAKMASIYTASYLTISAAVAETCQSGFLHIRQETNRLKYPQFRLPYQCPEEEEYGAITIEEEIPYRPFLEPINARAWTLQERLLSSRVLIYGTWHMRWECQSAKIHAGGAQERAEYSDGAKRLHHAFFSENLAEIGFNKRDLDWDWEEIVIDYSRRQLTVETDKLLAIAAIAERFRYIT